MIPGVIKFLQKGVIINEDYKNAYFDHVPREVLQ